jgi:hypothetical protein
VKKAKDEFTTTVKLGLGLKVNVFAILVDRHKKVYRKVNIGRLESGPIHGYILGIGRNIQTATKVELFLASNFMMFCTE